MTVAILVTLVSLGILIWSADQFVSGSAAAAREFELSPLFVGVVIIGFGTSAPELLVSIMAVSQQNYDIAIANVLGSNITNIGLILGLTALLAPIAVSSSLLKTEVVALAVGSALAVFLLLDGDSSRLDASILLSYFAALMIWQVLRSKQNSDDEFIAEVATTHMGPSSESRVKLAMRIGFGLLLMLACSRALIWGAVTFAQALGISERLIGLTIVAAGTSMPELVSSLIAARKGENELVFGNIVGSNLFNILGVLGIASLVSPMTVDALLLRRDGFVMLGFAISLFVVGYGRFGKGVINRLEGGAMLLVYCIYTGYLIAG